MAAKSQPQVRILLSLTDLELARSVQSYAARHGLAVSHLVYKLVKRELEQSWQEDMHFKSSAYAPSEFFDQKKK
jgi:hypothetical protein